MSISIKYYHSPVGELIIGSYGDKLCLCDWKYRKNRNTIDKRIQEHLNASYTEGTSVVIKKTIEQLEEYFRKERTDFDIPLLFVGTNFQKHVWDALLMIPYGKTESYAKLAARINNEKAIRAIATANGANAISVIVPCHRVIGSNGNLIGYAGGIDAKSKLLALENEEPDLFRAE